MLGVAGSHEIRADIPPQHDIAPEDQARATIYGLVANLFNAAPARSLLTAIINADGIAATDSDSGFARAWRELQHAAGGADAAALRQEFDDAFISTGRAPVFLYGSFYLTGFLMEKPLAKLREELAELGLARTRESSESEDHISALCDVMRFLIAGDKDTPPAALAAQREFFTRNIGPWYGQLCTAIKNAEQTVFYRKVAALAKEFFDLEVESFEIA